MQEEININIIDFLKNKKNKAVALWLITGVALIILQTVLGGVTRLTGSGLSITKWEPINGILPPLTQTDWEKAFNGYKQIGQYKILNNDFNLSDFKSIFFWEWLHRLCARMLGFVFIIGFVYFLIKNYFDKKMIKPFIILFILGGFQGFIGWLMVKTGLNSEDIHVHYIALSVHFVSAMILACYTLWFAFVLLIPAEKKVKNTNLFSFTVVITIILFFQLTYGAFMAGLKAAIVAPTWPKIGNEYFPKTLISSNWIHDADIPALCLNIQFIHRGLAYLLLILIIIWYIKATKSLKNNGNKIFKNSVLVTLVLVIIQIILGIYSVLNSVYIQKGKFGIFETLAEIHQLVAMFLLMSLVLNLYILKPNKYIQLQ